MKIEKFMKKGGLFTLISIFSLIIFSCSAPFEMTSSSDADDFNGLILSRNGAPAVSVLGVNSTVSPSDVWKAGLGLDPDTVQVELTIDGFGGTSSTILPIDVVFGIDSSGSMSTADPSGLRKSAAIEFLGNLQTTTDRAGTIGWATEAFDIFDLTNDFASLEEDINSLPDAGYYGSENGIPKGYTDMERGLQACVDMLDANPSRTQVIVFLTDGFHVDSPYTSEYTGEALADAVSKGIVIHTVGLGNVDVSKLTEMSDATGGSYFHTPTPENLQSIFDEIFTEVVTNTSPYDIDLLEITQNYIIEEGSFSIAPDSISEINGETHISWTNIAQYVGNFDNRLDADESFTVTFTAKSSQAGTALPVINETLSAINYITPDGSSLSASIPQNYINVEEKVSVLIDIKPDSNRNPINLKSKGVTPVAILGAENFDTATIDPATVLLGSASIAQRGKNLLANLEDVNSDGFMDLMCHVETQEISITDIVNGEMILTAKLYSEFGSTPIEGSDVVSIVP